MDIAKIYINNKNRLEVTGLLDIFGDELGDRLTLKNGVLYLALLSRWLSKYIQLCKIIKILDNKSSLESMTNYDTRLRVSA